LYGSKTDEYRNIRTAILGTKGLASCTDTVSFDASVDRIRKQELRNAPETFLAYFDQHVVPLLRANVVACRVGWTNNNAESVNHVLKQSVQWRPQQLPELVLKLKALVIGQHTEADRALVGRGDMQLMPSHIRHRVSLDHWKSMSAEQRQKAVNSCFRQTTIQSSTSTDGDLTVPLTPGAGKKPHQRKRKRANRTVTAAKKCKFDADDCASDTD
jgi:hypothetical protein